VLLSDLQFLSHISLALLHTSDIIYILTHLRYRIYLAYGHKTNVIQITFTAQPVTEVYQMLPKPHLRPRR